MENQRVSSFLEMPYGSSPCRLNGISSRSTRASTSGSRRRDMKERLYHGYWQRPFEGLQVCIGGQRTPKQGSATHTPLLHIWPGAQMTPVQLAWVMSGVFPPSMPP